MLKPSAKRPSLASLHRELGRRGGRPTRKLLDRLQGSWLRAGLLILLTAVLSLLYPGRQGYNLTWFLDGAIAREEVIAPESFYIYKSEADYLAEVQAARRSTRPVFATNARIPAEQQAAVRALFEEFGKIRPQSLPDSARLGTLRSRHPETANVSDAALLFLADPARSSSQTLSRLREAVTELLAFSYSNGLIESRSSLIGAGQDSVVVRSGDVEARVAATAIRDIDQLAEPIQQRIVEVFPSGDARRLRAAAYDLVAAYLVPNLSFDRQESEARRAAAAAAVFRIKGTVLRNERIIDEHDRITSEHVDKLRSLAAHLNERRQQDPYLPALQTVSRFVISGAMVAALFAFLALYREPVYRQTSSFILFGILLLMPAVVARYAAQASFVTPFLVPIALSAMLATVLFDAEVGFVVSVVAAGICSSILGSVQHSLVFSVTGFVAAFSVRRVQNRKDFYRAILYIVTAYVLTIGATGVLLFTYATVDEFVQGVKWDLAYGVFTAFAAAVLTIGLLPIFESAFNVVTSITLLELSDLNRPLLRNLAIRAPGTYSHSIIMASLSEAAAEAIGADPLLARVGCYYHDIGKMIRPHYFIENQKGVNPHDELQPRMSALILVSHVKEGMDLAREEGLPRAIVDIIPQHHGTSEIASFKHRALERGDKQAVRDEDFRYPGPRPQTKEAGIVNLADAVESATRTIPGSAPDQIKGMVQTIVKGRFTAGELDECDLTLRDLTKIQEAFLPILEATRHARVPYPWQAARQAGRERRPGRERREKV